MAVREAILDNVVTTLKTITLTNDYNNNVGLVTRERFNWNDLKPKDFPAALVTWTGDEKEEIGISGQNTLSRLALVIRGVVYAQKNLENEINQFLDDIEVSLCVDQYRGTYAEYTTPRRIRVYQGEKIYFAIFDFEFEILYQYIYGSP